MSDADRTDRLGHAVLRWLAVSAALFVFVAAAAAATAEGDAGCVECHKSYAEAVAAKEPKRLACAKCHDAADTAVVPHRNLGPFKAGGAVAVASKGCVSCHDKAPYSNLKHGTIGLGCSGCHDAHTPKHGKQRDDDSTAICRSCHEGKAFEGKVVHRPIKRGDCVDCHAVHATEYAGLLADPLIKTCMVCHGRVAKTRHVAGTGRSQKSHPVGVEEVQVMDPLRPGKPLDCLSCHWGHVSEREHLMRFDVGSALDFCQRCHRI